MDIDLKNTKIDMTGKSDAEKKEFQEYCFSRGVWWWTAGQKTQTVKTFNNRHYYLIDGENDLLVSSAEYSLHSNRDITEEWANRNKKEPRVYTSSKEDVADAVRNFVNLEIVEFQKGEESPNWVKGELYQIYAFDGGAYQHGNSARYERIRKLQKPVNPYEELEENGKYKVVEAELVDEDECEDDGFLYVKYNEKLFILCDWVSHKGFAGYVFKFNGGVGIIKDYYGSCVHPVYGHAVAVLFKVGE